MTDIVKIDLPYFDLICEQLASLEAGQDTLLASTRTEAERVEKVLGKHVHYGYWRDPERALAPNLDDYMAATEAMSLLHFDLAKMKSGQAVLDVGCGFGGSIDSINERYHDMDLVGLNIDARQLARARQQVVPRTKPSNKLRFVEGDACNLPPSFAGKFDVIMAMECIFHFPSRREFIRRASRALKPGGRLVISDFVARGVTYPLLLSATLFYVKDLRRTCGQALMPTTISHYRRMAEAAGLVPAEELDVTKNTLPTYQVMDQLATAFPQMERAMKRVNRFIRRISESGIYRYQLLSFRKPEVGEA